jgi:hypothetical protein
MQAPHVREVALVVGVATAGVVTVALIVIGPVAWGDAARYPHVTHLHAPVQVQP